METVVSEQVGPSMPPPQIQSMSVMRPPEPSDSYGSIMSTRYVQLSVAASGKVTELEGGD